MRESTLLRDVFNRCQMEKNCDSPDFVLAEYLIGCLNLYEFVNTRSRRLSSENKAANLAGKGDGEW